eukprot:Phypoly_transcript_14712.p1 GENE.Phypoly_transcript_14712~~Phypoly_transcript_14712.p1  ORF type:complete len:184 (+),score=37.63 Phypoly_transcript_14712:210-761(+)
MGIIRRESSDVAEMPQYKERQMSMDIVTELHGEDNVVYFESSSALPASTLSPVPRSPSARPTILPPLSHNPNLSSGESFHRDPLLSMSLDSSMLPREHEAHHHPLAFSASDAGKRTLSLDEMRSILMDHKQRVINKLEAMGYDPYKGVYVKHRKWLMTEKEKAVHRLEELGLDPYTGSKRARV